MASSRPDPHARTLAEAWLAGEWTVEGMETRTLRILGRDRSAPGLRALVRGFHAELRDAPHERRLEPLARAIAAHAVFRRAARRITLVGRALEPGAMADPPRAWAVPRLESDAAIADWLGIPIADVAWLADPLDLRNHYRRHWRGSRLIEAPRQRLAAAQRVIVDGLLADVPPHDAAHGFRRGRSVTTAVAPHCGRPVLIVMDLRAFFPSIRASRVHATFQRLGYPETVARTLTALCTTRCRVLPTPPTDVPHHVASSYRGRHLAQGAPTSPALANLAAFHLDARLAGLARALDARYTRYADDLIFSGPTSLRRAAFARQVVGIVRDEGFVLNRSKTRAMGQGTRQHVLGIVVNQRPTLPRDEFERLEATLHNLARRGAVAHAGQVDRRAQLIGRVAWARQVDPTRARRLEDLLAAIDWNGVPA